MMQMYVLLDNKYFCHSNTNCVCEREIYYHLVTLLSIMSENYSKTAGRLWMSYATESEQNKNLKMFASFLSMINAQLITLQRATTDVEKSKTLDKDLKELVSIESDFRTKISAQRDMTASNVRYAYTMAEIDRLMFNLMPICVYWELVEFPDGSRFGDY